jgi:hypothetical protein
MTGTQESRPSRLAQNEILYRSINERIENINKELDTVASFKGEWICECSDMHCTTRVVATIAEYESVRSNPRTFIVAPGHVDPYVEHVVRGNERFTVVEKEGAAAEAAELQDARSSG